MKPGEGDEKMIDSARAAMVWVSMSVAGSCFAATAGETPPPQTGATESVQPAPPPAKPAAAPAGFPAVVIPGAILIGIAAALATEDNDAQFPSGTGSTGTGP